MHFVLWLAAYMVLGLLLAIFVQSLVNWLLSLSGFHACRREFCFQIKTYMAVASTSSNK
jgi:hypothetical protein